MAYTILKPSDLTSGRFPSDVTPVTWGTQLAQKLPTELQALAVSTDPIEYLKLLLVPPGETKAVFQDFRWFRETEARVNASSYTPEALMAEFLAQLWRDAVDRIRESFRLRGLPFYSRVRFVLTLPAEWPRRAAEDLGEALEAYHAPLQQPIDWTSEPEAAAREVVHYLEGELNPQVKFDPSRTSSIG